jgi:hypothetical protein
MPESQFSAMQAWQNIVQTPEIIAYFNGVFQQAGVRIEETGEQFTVTHTGAAITFAPGIAPDVDFVVPLRLENVQNLVGHTLDGKIDPGESWRIVQVLFTPMTQATLRTPMMVNPWMLRLAGVEDRIHVHLLYPNGGDAATHTLIYEDGRWRVLSGLHGTAQRTYRLTPDQALDYQRHVTQAARQNSLRGWIQFALWYRQWRAAVSHAIA